VQIHDAKLGKKDWHRAQISSVGRKLLYEIHPSFLKQGFYLKMFAKY
jgi:hypothetical protein